MKYFLTDPSAEVTKMRDMMLESWVKSFSPEEDDTGQPHRSKIVEQFEFPSDRANVVSG
jgi:hypothetical protein